MTSAQIEYPTRRRERRARTRGERPALAAARERRTGMVSEAVVAGYIRDLARHGRRVHGAATDDQRTAAPRAELSETAGQ